MGETLKINGQASTIVGVAPEGFAGTSVGTQPLVYVPLTMRWLMVPIAPADEESRQSYWLYLGLYSGILNDIERPLVSFLTEEQMRQFLAHRVTLEPGARGQSFMPDTVERPLTLLLAVTALVLLIVCVNIANL